MLMPFASPNASPFFLVRKKQLQFDPTSQVWVHPPSKSVQQKHPRYPNIYILSIWFSAYIHIYIIIYTYTLDPYIIKGTYRSGTRSGIGFYKHRKALWWEGFLCLEIAPFMVNQQTQLPMNPSLKYGKIPFCGAKSRPWPQAVRSLLQPEPWMKRWWKCAIDGNDWVTLSEPLQVMKKSRCSATFVRRSYWRIWIERDFVRICLE